MKVPAFLLRRLYVKGSLRNVEQGFEFDLKNSLGSGYAERVLPISVDGEQLPIEQTRFVVDGESMPFASVSADQPMTLGMNKLVTIGFDGRTLDAGKHKIEVGFLVTGMGELQFDVTDAVDGA
jgi:hypothetical protein